MSQLHVSYERVLGGTEVTLGCKNLLRKCAKYSLWNALYIFNKKQLKQINNILIHCQMEQLIK